VHLGLTFGEARDKSVVNLGRWAHVAHRIYKPQSSRRQAAVSFSAEKGVGARIWLLMLATMGPDQENRMRQLATEQSFPEERLLINELTHRINNEFGELSG
jgi:hypothetical protein